MRSRSAATTHRPGPHCLFPVRPVGLWGSGRAQARTAPLIRSLGPQEAKRPRRLHGPSRFASNHRASNASYRSWTTEMSPSPLSPARFHLDTLNSAPNNQTSSIDCLLLLSQIVLTLQCDATLREGCSEEALITSCDSSLAVQ